ncbi:MULTISPECIES: hypothetical protein [Lactococcus]|uniref:Uncharacterized protein n=1 Tax=Lactococcus formosensis TaxID=1281486 RepID=A0A9X4P614_9LACT|nr:MULTISPECIES: hypothetical protein [Lactococcus]PST74036.1 hypothetical protein AEH57_01740 [Lactococcus garvieae]MDG6112238.1 hypothetical protein [Lactococcus formosensis]MDG6114485.1 hypothetical protein [Lactococcus formosensis]MDG6116630.1 hypothetical protein [Lactococcus formosensis]MDG6118415.1 hypothetical protein [Lactococcus formosensis]
MPRKTKYDTHIAPKLEEIKQWRAERLSIADIAKNLSVGLETLNRARLSHPELKEALKAPELTEDELFEKSRRERLNRDKYYNSTLSFIRRHATEEERFKIIQTSVNKVSGKEELEKIKEYIVQQLELKKEEG